MDCVTDLSHKELEIYLGQAICVLGLVMQNVTQRRAVEKLCGMTDLCEDQMELVVQFLEKKNVRRFWGQYTTYLGERRKEKDAAVTYDADARGP